MIVTALAAPFPKRKKRKRTEAGVEEKTTKKKRVDVTKGKKTIRKDKRNESRSLKRGINQTADVCPNGLWQKKPWGRRETRNTFQKKDKGRFGK